MTAISAAARLRRLLADQSQIIVCPGVYDGLTARIALQSGFNALYMVTVLFVFHNRYVTLTGVPFSDWRRHNRVQAWAARSWNDHT
jgi:hypothetical protein